MALDILCSSTDVYDVEGYVLWSFRIYLVVKDTFGGGGYVMHIVMEDTFCRCYKMSLVV